MEQWKNGGAASATTDVKLHRCIDAFRVSAHSRIRRDSIDIFVTFSREGDFVYGDADKTVNSAEINSTVRKSSIVSRPPARILRLCPRPFVKAP